MIDEKPPEHRNAFDLLTPDELVGLGTQPKPRTDEQILDDATKLDSLAYAQQRRTIADDLGVTAGDLDRIVRDRRKKERGADDLFGWDDAEPWPAPVVGVEVADAVE